jgi:hypothetical protein
VNYRLEFPYLIQRCTINTPLAEENVRLSQAVDMDYMGSAEFEFGALPKSFRRIEAVAEDWKCRLVPEITENDVPLRVYSAFEDEQFETYKGYLLELRAGKGHTKERTDFFPGNDYTKKYGKTNFWWDITNDVMFGFHKTFMKRVGHHVAASLAYMNEQKGK